MVYNYAKHENTFICKKMINPYEDMQILYNNFPEF